MGHHCRADDGGLLGFYEDDGFVRVLGQEVFFEEALGELPGFIEGAGFLEEAVDPVDFEFA